MKPGKSTKAKKLSKAVLRAKILRATGKLLEQPGSPVSVKRVAETAQISRVIIHRYFATADNLLDAYRLLRINLPKTTQPVLIAPANIENTVEECLSQLVIKLFNNLHEDTATLKSLRLEFLLGQTLVSERCTRNVLYRSIRREASGKFEDVNALTALLCGAVYFLLIQQIIPNLLWIST